MTKSVGNKIKEASGIGLFGGGSTEDKLMNYLEGATSLGGDPLVPYAIRKSRSSAKGPEAPTPATMPNPYTVDSDVERKLARKSRKGGRAGTILTTDTLG